MRIAIALTPILFMVGCGHKTPDMRPDPVEIKVTVKLPGGASAKDLNVTLQPTQNTPPAFGKVGSDGTFTVQITPGDYVFYISEESNGSVAAFKNVAQKYRSPSEENKVEVEKGKDIVIELK